MRRPAGRRPAALPGPPAGTEIEVAIERLGAAGDGIATLDGAPLYVPLALPGERWRVRLDPAGRHARPIARLAGPPRAEPPCPHFGHCGGCALQHLDDAAYLAVKLARIHTALARAGLEPETLLPPARSPAGSRRRLRLAFESAPGRLRLGFRGRRSHALVAVERCPVACPPLERLLGPLARALGAVPLVRRAGRGEVLATLTEAGVDLLLEVAGEPTLEDRQLLAALADRLDLARLALARPGGPAEPLAARRPPRLRLGSGPGSILVEPPPGAFLQPTAEGERALRAAVARWIPEGARLADLYAGLGALSLPLLPRLAALELVEADGAMTAAVGRALAGRPGVRATRRDLARDPLRPEELGRLDAVLLDPPRAGARAQVAVLAAAAVPRIVYASCDPESFARDARALVAAGFALRALEPVDQFLWSAEVELVALLERPPRGRPGPRQGAP